jgi:hypothetical protein
MFEFGLKPLVTRLKNISAILTPKRKSALPVPENCLDFTFHSPSVDGSFLLTGFDEMSQISEISKVCENLNFELHSGEKEVFANEL